MHAGVPCISMNFPEYQNLNREFETAVLIDDLSAESICAAIAKLGDPDFYAKLKGNCGLAREVYNWQLEEQKLFKIYADC